MAKAKFRNDTTKTRLGDQYQYLIALECCINAKSDDDIIYIEQRGDVATKDTSTEVKHHSDPNHKISDRHVDFWKTLKNWVVNYEVLSFYKYKKLVLLTTSHATATAKISDWNSLTPNEKLKTITDIKDQKTTDSIKAFVDVVFTYSGTYTEDTLLKILDKFCISYNQPIISEKVNSLLDTQFFTAFPNKNRMPFLDSMLSFILSAGRGNAENWEIKVSEFHSFVQSNAKNYTSEAIPIPDTYRSKTVDPETYKDFNFVNEIRRVRLETEIPSAANDYFRTQLTVLDIKNHDLLFNEEFSYYQDEVISADLRLIKGNCELEIKDKKSIDEMTAQSIAVFT